MTCLNDPINVTCQFRAGKIKPLSFEWRHRLYSPLKTVFQYQTHQGTNSIIVFSCQTSEGIFDLVFNLKTLSWKIKSVHEEM